MVSKRAIIARKRSCLPIVDRVFTLGEIPITPDIFEEPIINKKFINRILLYIIMFMNCYNHFYNDFVNILQ